MCHLFFRCTLVSYLLSPESGESHILMFLYKNTNSLKKPVKTVAAGLIRLTPVISPSLNSIRQYSTMPSFNPNSTFEFVSQPAPNWKVGDGLSNPFVKGTSSGRKTWDLSKLESPR